MRRIHVNLLPMALFLVLTPAALASTTWYVNGVNGSDSNNCLSPTTACKTIGHAISLASSGDTIMVAAATYKENLSISKSLNIIGFRASTTIIDGGGINTVVTVSKANAHVSLSGLTIQNGSAQYPNCGAGISNTGATLAISHSIVRGNHTPYPQNGGGVCNGTGTLAISTSTVSGNQATRGGGIANSGTLTISQSTISGNQASGTIELPAHGGGISNLGQLTISTSTISGNSTSDGLGGGIYSEARAKIDNSTISTNSVIGVFNFGGGIESSGTTTIDNSTISGNSAANGSGIDSGIGLALQNSIVASNPGANCNGTITSKGYNLSSDGSCNFNGPGDLNNTDPKLGPLQSNGGPTQTQALLSGSPAIDAGNASGCTDSQGHLLKTDQRGMPRPDKEDSGGCDMGAYERQSD